MGIYTILGGQVDMFAHHPPGLLAEILNWRQRCISSQLIVQQTVSGWSVGLGEGESEGRNRTSVAPVSDSCRAKTADGHSVRMW